MNVEVWAHRSLLSEPLASLMVSVAGAKESAESLGRAWLGREVAFSGSLGCCGPHGELSFFL